ncbi:MAG: MBL fold metallo-hydrolase [Candidatus Paceibacterota bacterium]
MKITKFAQCCLLIEVDDKRILTDPGRFSTAQNELTDIDIVLITHEHADHLHSESVQAVMRNNPEAKLITNSSVGKVLDELEVTYTVVEGRDVCTTCDIALAAFDGPHAEIYESFGLVQNTGYFIADSLFYPGDAYTEPGRDVPILALPVAGPWCKSAEAIAYAKRVNPTKAFPVHDWLLNEDGIALTHGIFGTALQEAGIEFVPLQNNETKEF